MNLSERERSILDLERTWWTDGGSKQDAIRERLSLSPGRYYQVLAALLDRPEASDYDPLVVARLRRERTRRRQDRVLGRQVRPR
jgi:hypothetical protein